MSYEQVYETLLVVVEQPFLVLVVARNNQRDSGVGI
jgi:DNA-binding protein Fis